MKNRNSKISYFPLLTPPVKKMPVYTSRQDWETLVQEFQDGVRKRTSSKNAHSFDEGDLKGPYFRRRKNAVLDQMQTIYERYGKSLPDTAYFTLGEEWIVMNHSRHSYAYLEADWHILFAASIWILDHIENKGKVYRLLPRKESEIEDIYEPDVYVPEYQYNLIASVQYVLEHRNGEPEITSGKQFRRVLTDFASTNESFARTEKSEDRQTYEELIALLPKDAIQHAVEAFERLLWEFTDQYFKGLQPFYETARELYNRHDRVYVRYKAAVEDANAAIREYNETGMLKSRMPGPYSSMASATQSRNALLRMPALDEKESRSFPFGIDKLYEIVEKTEGLEKKYREVVKQLCDAIDAQDRYRANVCLDGFQQNENTFEIEDPYEICFALLYLIDTGSDLPWIYGAGMGAMMAAVDQLPWGVRDYREMDDAFLDYTEEKIAPAPNWYERKYTRGNDPAARSLVQILYEATGCIVPRKFHRYDGLYEKIKEYGVEDPDMVLSMMNALSSTRRQDQPLNLDTNWEWDENGEISDTGSIERLLRQEAERIVSEGENDKKIQMLLNENRRLRSEVYLFEKEAHDAKMKLEVWQEAARREHRELADLRSLVFASREDVPSEEKEDTGIALPYEVQRMTIIFGGHDSWVKAIRPLLNGAVRYVSKETLSFDRTLIRNTEVIWIQTSAISHAQYGRIMDASRQYKTQIRYFTSTSAVRCAQELAQYDRL